MKQSIKNMTCDDVIILMLLWVFGMDSYLIFVLFKIVVSRVMVKKSDSLKLTKSVNFDCCVGTNSKIGLRQNTERTVTHK